MLPGVFVWGGGVVKPADAGAPSRGTIPQACAVIPACVFQLHILHNTALNYSIALPYSRMVLAQISADRRS